MSLLTDEEIGTLFDNHDMSWRDYARAIEASVLQKLREHSEPVAWQNKYLPNSFYTHDNLNPQWGLDDMIPLYEHPAPQSEWISMDDRLPEDQQCVLCAGPVFNDATNFGYFQVTLTRTESGWVLADNYSGEVWAGWGLTHWQPLPQPPEAK